MNGIVLGNGLREAKRWWVEYRRENYFRFFVFVFCFLSFSSFNKLDQRLIYLILIVCIFFTPGLK